VVLPGPGDGPTYHPEEIRSMPRPLDPVTLHAACRQLKVRSDYLLGLLDGLGTEPAKVRQLPVLSPEQFDQVKARVEVVRAARGREVSPHRGRADEP
jgi:hypothetical protein